MEMEQPAPIPWSVSEGEAQEKAAARERPVMVLFSGSPECAESQALESVTFAEQRVVEFIDAHLVPLRFQASEQPELVARHHVTRTPTVLLADANGNVYFRIEGFLPPDDFLSRLSMGVGAFECQLEEPPPDEHVDAVQTTGGGSDVAAQALYWQATARFRRTGDTQRLRSDWQAIAAGFPRSVWALRTRLTEPRPAAG
jgi:hypothetical protein